LAGTRPADDTPVERRGPLPPGPKPVIGAINGAAITGGFELALACDFLVASDRARFADTHARVGIQPWWGLSVLLPQAIGLRRAREMSATGNFIDAQRALEWGLVNHVVPHDDLLGFTRGLAADVASTDQAAMRQVMATYTAGSRVTVGEAWLVESEAAAAWQGRGLDPTEIERRRQHITERGRTQLS
jgi:enoyl-CoA hydratase